MNYIRFFPKNEYPLKISYNFNNWPTSCALKCLSGTYTKIILQNLFTISIIHYTVQLKIAASVMLVKSKSCVGSNTYTFYLLLFFSFYNDRLFFTILTK